MSDRKKGFSPLNAENNRDVTNDVMFAYAHMKVNILLSVLSIFSFFFYDLPWIHKVLCTKNLLSISWAIIETCKCSQNAIYAYLLYSCFINRCVQAFFLYRNKSYIILMLGLAKIEY